MAERITYCEWRFPGGKSILLPKGEKYVSPLGRKARNVGRVALGFVGMAAMPLVATGPVASAHAETLPQVFYNPAVYGSRVPGRIDPCTMLPVIPHKQTAAQKSHEIALAEACKKIENGTFVVVDYTDAMPETRSQIAFSTKKYLQQGGIIGANVVVVPATEKAKEAWKEDIRRYGEECPGPVAAHSAAEAAIKYSNPLYEKLMESSNVIALINYNGCDQIAGMAYTKAGLGNVYLNHIPVSDNSNIYPSVDLAHEFGHDLGLGHQGILINRNPSFTYETVSPSGVTLNLKNFFMGVSEYNELQGKSIMGSYNRNDMSSSYTNFQRAIFESPLIITGEMSPKIEMLKEGNVILDRQDIAEHKLVMIPMQNPFSIQGTENLGVFTNVSVNQTTDVNGDPAVQIGFIDLNKRNEAYMKTYSLAKGKELTIEDMNNSYSVQLGQNGSYIISKIS